MRALTPADNLHSLLEWNPVVQPVAIFQTDSGYNLVTSAVEGEQKQVQVFYIAKHLQYKTQNAATI